MAQFGGKNTPWNRAGQSINPQLFGGVNAFAVSQAAALQQLGAGLSVGALGGGVIPTVNAAAFTTPQQAAFANAVNNLQTLNRSAAQNVAAAAIVAQQQQKNQRAFIGTVTKLQEQYGFVDDDVFFKLDVVRGSIPRIGEKVMVEAAYNPTMPFKWNAFRVQLLPTQDAPQPLMSQQSMPPSGPRSQRGGDDQWRDDRRGGTYGSSGPAPRRLIDRSPPPRRLTPPRRGSPSYALGSVRRGSPPPAYTRRRSPAAPNSASASGRSAAETGGRKREHSPARSSTGLSRSSRSPPRRKPRQPIRYAPAVPKNLLEIKDASVFDLRKRYATLYVPSDFFHVSYDWPLSVPANKGFSLAHEVAFHISHKDVDDFYPQPEAVIDPPDANYTFSAKVMLLSLPSIQEIYKKVIGLQDDGRIKDDFESAASIARVVHFLVGVRGKNESMAIGGPWSPSLDGTDPENDPSVLIKTAIRTTKALCGIDLSKCSQWLKFVQVRYRRSAKEQLPPVVDSSTVADADAALQRRSAPVLETVAIFLPDVWNLAPNKTDFETFQHLLKSQLDFKLSALESPPEAAASVQIPSAAIADQSVATLTTTPAAEPVESEEMDTSASVENVVQQQPEPHTTQTKPTHWRKLDIKSMKVNELKHELELRGVETKGIKSQLVSKLTKIVKDEQGAELAAASTDQVIAVGDIEKVAADSIDSAIDAASSKTDKTTSSIAYPDVVVADTVKKSEEDQHEDESQQAAAKADSERDIKRQREKEERERRERKKELERHYNVAAYTQPGIFVFPSKTYKNGKFECRLASLSSLLSYRLEDNKEHIFEVSLFAEAFNEMLLRDGAFSLYKALLCMYHKDEEMKREKAKKEVEEKGKKELEEKSTVDKRQDVDTDTITAEPNKEAAIEPAAESVENGMITEAGKDDSKKDVTKSKSLDTEDKKADHVLPDADFCLSMSLFDTCRCGYLQDKEIEEIFHSIGLWLSRSQIQKLIKCIPHRDGFHYRKVTDFSTDIAEFTNTGLIKTINDRASTASGKAAQGSIVSYNGRLVDVEHTLQQIDKLEKEKQTITLTHDALEKEMKGYKEHRDILERKKRRLEEDVRDYKKRLYEAEKFLKTTQDDTVLMKTALHRCKELADVIGKTVEKTMPKREPSPDKTTKATTTTSAKPEASVVKDEKTKEGVKQAAEPSPDSNIEKASEKDQSAVEPDHLKIEPSDSEMDCSVQQ